MRFGRRYFHAQVRGVTPKEKFRLSLLIAACLALVAIMLWTYAIARRETPGPEPRPDRVVAGRYPSGEPVRPPEPPEPFPDGKPAPRGRVVDRSARIEWDYVAYLLHELAARKEALLQEAPREVSQRTFFRPEAAEELRGRWVFATGTVAAAAQPGLVEADPNPSGIWTVYDTFVKDKDGKALRVWLIDKEREYWPGEAVLFRGLFYKIHRYRDLKGEVADVPLFIALPFEPLPPPEDTLAWLPIPVAGVVILTSIILAISVFVTSRGDRKARETRIRRRAERHRARGREGSPEQGPPEP